MSSIDQVVDCCATTGDADYLLRIVARDLRSFSTLINQELLGHGDIARVHSSVVLERIKRTTTLPLPVPSPLTAIVAKPVKGGPQKCHHSR